MNSREEHPAPVPPADPGSFSSGVDLLSKSLKAVFVIFGICITLLMVWFLTCGGSFIVDSTSESVIVLKFGKFHGEYKEGWHWFLPYPINKIVRIPTRKETIVSSAFMPSNAAKLRDPNAKTLMGNEVGDALQPGVDGYALLKDNSIVHSEWVLTYRISDPRKFYFNFLSSTESGLNESADAESIRLDSVGQVLKVLLDDSVITAGSSLTIDDTYYNPDRYLQTVRGILEQRINELDIGVTMDNLTLSLVAPPLKTQLAFQEFLLAKTLAQRELEAARTYEVEQEKSAAAEKEQIISGGKIAGRRIESSAKADAEYLQKLTSVFKDDATRNATLSGLYTAAMTESLSRVKEKYLVATDPKSQTEVRIKFTPEGDTKNKTNDTKEKK